MFGRMFGRGKDESDQAICAECGRTLLAGEWTQKVVDADGEERLICSLCGQTRAQGGAEPVAASPTPANNGRVRESREDVPEPRAEARDARAESDTFWKALKDKDAEIARLTAQLALVEAQKQELAGQLARAHEAPVPAEPLVPFAAGPGVTAAAGVSALTGDSSEPGERTWGETPAEFAAELATLRDEAAATPPAAAPGETSAVAPAPREVPSAVFEDTQPIPALSDEAPAERGDALATAAGPQGDPETTLTPEPTPAVPAETGVSSVAAETAALVAQASAEPEASVTAAASAEPAASTPTAADLEAEAASMTLLQRGVDLLNVSRVPHKISETNEQLGLPSVHVGHDGHATVVTFMWSMGWYRFHVDSESGDIRMVDRGYDELADVRPNAGVRADGTVQLDPAQISRAAAQRPQPEPQRAPQSASEAPPAPTTPEPPSAAAQKPPEILSKSLLGQRSDDEAASWEQTQARDFDWDR
jgi:hypothetical protein